MSEFGNSVSTAGNGWQTPREKVLKSVVDRAEGVWLSAKKLQMAEAVAQLIDAPKWYRPATQIVKKTVSPVGKLFLLSDGAITLSLAAGSLTEDRQAQLESAVQSFPAARKGGCCTVQHPFTETN